MKKLLKVIACIILFLSIIGITAIYFFVKGITADVEAAKKTITIQKGEDCFVAYSSVVGLHDKRWAKLCQKVGDKEIELCGFRGDEFELISVKKGEKVEGYYIYPSRYILYRYSGEDEYAAIDVGAPKEYPSEVVKYLRECMHTMACKDLFYLDGCMEILIKNEDSVAVDMMKAWASGTFSTEEEKNLIDTVKVQELSVQVLQKHNISF